MSVNLLVNCPFAKDTDEVRETLICYLRHGVCVVPIDFIKIARCEENTNTTPRFIVDVNQKKIEMILSI